MKDSKMEMFKQIRNLFSENLTLLQKKIPLNGIWSVCSIQGTDYQGAVRVIPSDTEEGIYFVWVDVFETVYDPVFSNTLFKGNLQQVVLWHQNQDNIENVYNCMHHLYELAIDD